ncbi:hypothetical protein [Parasedimentitalea psychrophila]|uniref:Uncharacterized protein n=1 Tax=Parasedimentitalea psychrophila TaxID=2997337 RepID=A0A9Y2P2W1_9RHOB|nr:hypothetical protein [Parasedimentitalea psychrophila]WIY23639.1 hypothetical protein QPJ95_13375 [Parasedimentitalea psychrophila]
MREDDCWAREIASTYEVDHVRGFQRCPLRKCINNTCDTGQFNRGNCDRHPHGFVNCAHQKSVTISVADVGIALQHGAYSDPHIKPVFLLGHIGKYGHIRRGTVFLFGNVAFA